MPTATASTITGIGGTLLLAIGSASAPPAAIAPSLALPSRVPHLATTILPAASYAGAVAVGSTLGSCDRIIAPVLIAWPTAAKYVSGLLLQSSWVWFAFVLNELISSGRV